jgi:hypothetical protein
MGGPDRAKHLRNAAIVVVLAVLVWKLPGGGEASLTISNLLSIIFVGGLFFFAFRMYMERRESLLGMDHRLRAVLYGSAAMAAFALVATRRLWDAGGLGTLLWLALMIGAGWGVYTVWRASRAY